MTFSVWFNRENIPLEQALTLAVNPTQQNRQQLIRNIIEVYNRSVNILALPYKITFYDKLKMLEESQTGPEEERMGLAPLKNFPSGACFSTKDLKKRSFELINLNNQEALSALDALKLPRPTDGERKLVQQSIDRIRERFLRAEKR